MLEDIGEAVLNTTLQHFREMVGPGGVAWKFAPLKLEAEYDALRKGGEPDYSLWLGKVAGIKSRYPLPVF